MLVDEGLKNLMIGLTWLWLLTVITVVVAHLVAATPQVHPTDEGCWKFKGPTKVYEEGVRQPGWCYDPSTFWIVNPVAIDKDGSTWLITHQLMNDLIWSYYNG